MPIFLTDILVPVAARRRDHDSVVDHYCTLCDELVGSDDNFQPEPHRLDECLGRLLDSLREKREVR